VGELANQGYDIAVVARDVLALLRDLVVAKVCAGASTSDLLDLADEERRDVAALSERTDPDDLVRLHQGFSAGFDDVVRSGEPRAALEMLLVRLARRPALLPLDDLVTRLAALEKRLTGGGGPAPRGGSPQSPPRGSGPPRTEPRPMSSAPERPSGRESRATGSTPRATAPEPTEEPPRAPLAINGAAPAPRIAQTTSPAPGEPEALLQFRAIVERVRAVRPELAAFLNHASVITATADRVVIAFEAGSVFDRNARAPDAVPIIEQAVRDHFGSGTVLVFETTEKSSAGATVSSVDEKERNERKQAAISRAKGHPRIAQAAEILGARLKEIRIPED
jgi:DNA polymerase-3 subunit gamma/tau